MKIKRKVGHLPRPCKVLAIDPGQTESAYVYYDMNAALRRRILEFGKVKNSDMLLRVLSNRRPDIVVCEEIRSYGMPVGQTTFDTVRFTGRVQQLCMIEGIPFALLPRFKVKSALKPLPRRNDRDVRSSLIQLYGAPGTAQQRGPTYGITKDVWAALGVAHAFRLEKLNERNPAV